MSEKNTELSSLNGHTSSEDQNNSASSELIERIPMEGTPFTAIRKEDIWFLSWGNYRLSEERGSLKEIEVFLNTNMWDIIAVYTISVMAEMKRQEREQMEKALNANQ